MNEDIVAITGFFITAIVIALGVPLVRALVRRWDRQAIQSQVPLDASARLERIEQAIEAMSIEVERIAEGQRYMTRVMTEGSPEPVALPHRSGDRNA